MNTGASLVCAATALLLWPRVSGAQRSCAGDCSRDGRVAVNELVIGVNVALGSAAVADCTAADIDDDGSVSVAELVTAVNSALQGCGGGPSATPTSSLPSATPTVTSTPAIGPTVTFFGVTSADDTLQPPTATAPGGIPIYQRPFGFGFSLVVEASAGVAQCPPPDGPVCPVEGGTFASGGVPDLQVQATRPLGDGSASVCDNGSGDPPLFGGVPGIDPPQLEQPSAIADALNDFGCRFIDGTGNPTGRRCNLACVRFEDGEFHCIDEGTEFQFCAPIPMPLQFPDGDTLVTVRVRDAGGNLGPPAQLILRVAP